ncbi:hypothetical protein GpartN1_g3530.t1 [Galdieria partita]|uniref:Uncharacterized protein n=1 Tax=Galdieria partita TaxID=83374 RepID=A0A9C7UQ99_9RHOD|nr:hypothetical protein GpartN1_g3530.t1 [Galdieria partita]
MGSFSFINIFSYRVTLRNHNINQTNKSSSQKAKYSVSSISKASPTLRSIFQLKDRMEERNPLDQKFFSGIFSSSLKFCRRCGKAFIASCPGIRHFILERSYSIYSTNSLFNNIVVRTLDRPYWIET